MKKKAQRTGPLFVDEANGGEGGFSSRKDYFIERAEAGWLPCFGGRTLDG